MKCDGEAVFVFSSFLLYHFSFLTSLMYQRFRFPASDSPPFLSFPPLPLPKFLLRYKVGRAWYKREECKEQEESAFKEEERILHWADGWYPATVKGVTGNGTSDEYTYSLRYEDGEEIGAAKENDMTKLDEELEKRSFEEHVRTRIRVIRVFCCDSFSCYFKCGVISDANTRLL